MNNRKVLLLALALVSGVSSLPTYAEVPSPQSIDSSINRAMQEFTVPGMAVAVVYEGNLYYSAGHGIREIGRTSPVSDKTLFQVASITKAFTAAALAILVDEGEVDWDDPVIDYLPEFRMYDPWVTREFTVRDLLTHRSGLPLGAGDLLFFPRGNTTKDEVIRALRYLKPSSSFRAKFDYDNLMYIVAGEVVARVAGTSFEAFLEDRLLAPLGMLDCSATLERADPKSQKATPHVLVDDVLETTDSMEASIAAAAGGINCSAKSMSAWASFILDKGRNADGDQIITEAQVAELLSPVTLLPPREYFTKYAGTFLSAYALGWNVSTFYGKPMYSHAGGLWGMSSYLAILPDQGIAVFVSSNQMSAAPLAATNDILHHFLLDDAPNRDQDWISIIAEVANTKSADADTTVADAAAVRAADSKPCLPLDAYVGTYHDAWYGDIAISLNDEGKLLFSSARAPSLSGELQHFQFDTFIARWTERKLNADAYVSFVLAPDGDVEAIRMKAVSPATDFSFDFHDLDLVRVTAE